MSVKNLVILAAAGVFAVGATAALAGGPDMAPAPAFQPKVYLEGHAGYALSDWKNFGTFFTTSSNRNGGFTVGGDLGYQFTRNLAVEFGGFYLPRVTGTFRFPFRLVKVSSWFLYAAGKVTVPVYNSLDVFAKAGVAWRQLDWKGAFNNSNTSYWRPMFAAGLNYQINDNWNVGAQYMLIPGSTNFSTTSLSRQAPSANLFTGFIGYSFAV